MTDDRWQQLRTMFDAACELPPTAWRTELGRMTNDPALLDEVIELLEAQTMALDSAQRPLRELIVQLAEPDVQVGERIGPWRLTRRVASGGMGAVFLAERADETYQQRVAIKLLRGLATTEISQRLAAERQMLAGLEHPNIARLYDGGSTPSGQPYLVMEYVDGEPLDRACCDRPLDLSQRLQLFVRICRTVQAAHARLVVHCDLKPSNILVRADTEPVLLDFGIARWLDSAAESRADRFYTPVYASPELIAGEPVGVTTDVYSLGVILVEMLADRRLGHDGQPAGAAVPLPSRWARPSCAWRKHLEGDLDAIAAKASARDPAQRYGSVEALADDIERWRTHHPVRARGGRAGYRTHRWLRRHWQAAGVAVAVTAMAGGFVWRLSESSARAQEEAAIAEQVSEFLVAAFDAADPRERGARGTEDVSARAVLDASAAQVDAELADSPALRARLQSVLGRAYQNIGLPKQAETLLRSAAEGLASPSVDRARLAAQTYSDLSVEMSNGKRGEEGLKYAERALQLLDREDDARTRAHVLNSLGLAYSQLERYPESEAAFQQSLAMRSTVREPGTEGGTATVMQNMGLMYRNRGELDKSEQLLRDSLEIKRRRSETSADYQHGLHALAMTLQEGGKPNEAAPLLLQSRDLSLQLYGQDSSRTALAYCELALLHMDLGRYTESAEGFDTCLRISALTSGEDSIDHAINLNNYANLEEARGDMGKAEQLYRRSLAIRRQVLGPDKPSSLRAEMNLARLLMRSGRADQAGPLIQRVLPIWQRISPADAPDLSISHLGEIEWMIHRGQSAQAEQALLAMAPIVPSMSPPLQLRYQQMQAEAALRAGQAALAATRWRAVLEGNVALFGAEAPSVARYRVPLAEALQANGEREAARRQIAQAKPLLEAELVPGAPYLQRLHALEERLKG